jgi:hypothetical protein
MSKPILTFVKMMGCGPCNNFFGSPEPEKSQWAQLVKDPELNKIVEFSLTEWGFDRVTGAQYKKPTHLNFVQYGPAFVLVDGSNKETHLEYNKGAPKTAAGIKKWVLENHKKLKTVVPAPGTPTTSAVTSSRTPVKAVPGAPRAFVPQQKLPPQLRDRVTPSKIPPHSIQAIQSPPPQVVTVPAPQLQIAQAPTPKPVVKSGPAPLRIVARNTKYIGRRR